MSGFAFLLLVHLPSAAIAALLAAIALAPLISFYRWGWQWKHEDILGSLSDAAKGKYLDTFHKIDPTVTDVGAEFDRIYTKWYGRAYLIPPTIILAVLILVQAFFLAELGLAVLFPNSGYVTLPGIAAAGFAGAYLFTVADLIRRDRRKDVTSGDIRLASLRIALAIAIGYSFAAIVKEDVGAFVAFAVGAFPLSTLQIASSRIANRYLDLDIGPDSRSDQIVKLSGVDPPIADRVGFTGITTIAQLAYCDPVQLTMQTNLSYSYVMDIVGQALAWIYLEDKLLKLRASGLRGAIEIKHLYETLTNGSKNKAEAAALLAKLAVELEMSEEGLTNTFFEIARDPYTEFLEECW